MTSSQLFLSNVEVAGVGHANVRVQGDRVSEIGRLGRQPVEQYIEGGGGALLAGLHDHHCHVLAAAAARSSAPCGPPQVSTEAELATQLRATRPVRGWIRGVGYDEAVAGDLNANVLDRLSPNIPTRVQHRSGALWILNTAGCNALHLEDAEVDGVERDGAGRPTGRLWRLDAWLRERLGAGPHPDISELSKLMAARGMTGITDATPDLPREAVCTILGGGLVQRLVSLGEAHGIPQVGLGPRKIVVPDHDLPSFGELEQQIRARRTRPVAIHCVTRNALVLTLAVLENIGVMSGDRIEHAAVCPPECADMIARLGLSVVTQPSMIVRHGDDYLNQVDSDDLPHLWPFASLLAAGVRVGCSSDAPYGDSDPWKSMAAAVERRSGSGRPVSPAQRVDAWAALCGYLSPPDDPGGPPRVPAVGQVADLCLLDRPLKEALRQPGDVNVLMTLVGGTVVHRSPGLRVL